MSVYTLYTDASFCPRERVGGYGFRLHGMAAKGKPAMRLGGGALAHPVTCNNTAEMTAIVMAFLRLASCGHIEQGDKVKVITDSFFCIDRLQKLKKLRCTEEQKALVAHFDATVERLSLDVSFKYVRSHTSGMAYNIGNNWCDREAKKHMETARRKHKANGNNETESCM